MNAGIRKVIQMQFDNLSPALLSGFTNIFKNECWHFWGRLRMWIPYTVIPFAIFHLVLGVYLWVFNSQPDAAPMPLDGLSVFIGHLVFFFLLH
jgi:hypothetical protein